MSLTLVGNGLGWPVASSRQSQLSDALRSCTGLDAHDCDVGLQPSPSRQIFPLPSPVRSTPHLLGSLDVAGQGPTDTGDIAIDNEPEHKSPWAKLFAQGAMTTIVYDR